MSEDKIKIKFNFTILLFFSISQKKRQQICKPENQKQITLERIKNYVYLLKKNV